MYNYNYEKECNDFIFLKPNTSTDIVVEGYKLNHCVGSYVDDVYEKYYLIYFLREKESSDKPLVTIEVRDNRIIQAKGHYNRNLNKKELAVLKLWSKYFNLKMNIKL